MGAENTMTEEYRKVHEKLLRCWNCKRVIDITGCLRCQHPAETCICPYCSKCLCESPKFQNNDTSEVIFEEDGSWHVGPWLNVQTEKKTK